MSMRYKGGVISATPPTISTSSATGIWTRQQQMQAQGAGTWPPYIPLDPYFNYVTALLHGDGTNGAQNNTFLDSSTNNFTITRNGNTTQGTFSPYGSLWSNYFGGAGNYFTVPSTLSLGSSNYTVEFWFCGSQFEMTWGTPGGYAPIVINNNGDVYFADSGNTNWNYNVNAVITKNNTWNHYAIVRNSGVVYVYRNGVQVGTSSSVSSNTTNGNVVIGNYGSGTTGYVSNFRCVIGTAVYTSAFTPPTSPLTAITNTALLISQSNRFIDNSTNAYALTLTGTPSTQRFSPFNPSSAYSPSVIGGSGYFDGSGDYLSVADNPALTLNGDFTIEFWFYPLNTTFSGLAQHRNGGGWSSGDFQFHWQSSAVIFYTPNGSVSTTTVSLNTWNHVAISRSGSTVSAYLNGTRSNTWTDTTSYTGSGGIFRIGELFDGTHYYFNGYMSDFRIVKGSSVYTGSTFTVPTSPLTAITNTQLLLNYTNGGIYDNAMMNDLETIGNAQISTSVVKFGTGSMYFDGSGDYLTGVPSPVNALGGGDFTVEAWIYLLGYNGGWAIYSQLSSYTSSTAVLFYINGGGNLKLNINGSETDFGSISLNTWHQVALVRSGSTITGYVDGTSGGSTSNSTNFSDQYLVIGRTAFSTASNYAYGYIDDFRITKGYARYTANFTPPTAEFPNQ